MAVDCQRIEQEAMIEKYLAGKLAEPEAEAFEQHYLGCQSCFDELQFRHATAIELKAQGTALPRTVVVPKTPWRTWAMAAAILLVTLVSVPFFYQRNVQVVHDQPSRPFQPDDRENVIARLASVEAPPYLPLTLRGGTGSPALQRLHEGMRRYEQRDYAGASGLLQQAVGLKPISSPPCSISGSLNS